MKHIYRTSKKEPNFKNLVKYPISIPLRDDHSGDFIDNNLYIIGATQKNQ